MCVSVCACWSSLSRRPAGQALHYPLFFACIGATLVTWGALLWSLKHPLYLELLTVFRSRFPLLTHLEQTRP
jgi:hypothetical protein